MSGNPCARGWGFANIELLIALGLLLVLGVFTVIAVNRARETANRTKCASQLRSLGQCILLYSNENRGSYPQTIYRPGPSVVPTWGTGATATDPFGPDGPGPNDVSSVMFLLLRTQEATSEVFVCPSSAAERWDFGGAENSALNWSNWRDLKRHLSYSVHNPYPDDAAVAQIDLAGKGWWTNSMRRGFALMADLNPGVGSGRANPRTVTTTSPSREMRLANSPNHGGAGQNVLYDDGHVAFAKTPFAGANGDNIYLTRDGKIAGSMRDAGDSILLPPAR